MNRILLGHGSGGKLTANLIKDIFYKHLGNDFLARETDGANLGTLDGEVVTTTDGFVVSPLFFPGGDIGKLAVCGTLNDLAVMGAKPKYLTLSFIIEEGFLVKDLEKIVVSIAKEAKEAGVMVVAGDTKVVEKGNVDGLYISTTGIGVRKQEGEFPKKIEKGDLIAINGSIGDHAVALIAARGDFDFKTDIKSDCQNLSRLCQNLAQKCPSLKFMRDITRGGLATILNEVSSHYGVGIEIEEAKVPIKKEVSSVCNLLGFDPFYLANEGKLVAIVSPEDKLPDKMIVIGKITGEHGKVVLRNEIGGRRIIDTPDGEILPRIC
jgi:hydrogenase expression/formation protein HypE